MFKPEDIVPGLRVARRDGSAVMIICKIVGQGFVPIIESSWTVWPMPISEQGVCDVLNEHDMVIYEPTCH